MRSPFCFDTRPGGGVMTSNMVRNDPEHQRGYGTQWRDNPGKQQFDRKDDPMQTTSRTLTVAWPLVIFLLLPALTRAETSVEAWVQRYDGSVNGDDYAKAVA